MSETLEAVTPGLVTAAADRIGLGYLLARLDVVEARVRRVLAEREPGGEAPAELPTVAEEAGTRLGGVARAWKLDATELELFLVALAPEVEARFGQLYGYLQDEVGCRHATVGLAGELCGTRLVPGAALLSCGLMVVTDTDRPFPARSLRVTDRVAGHLLGDDRLDPLLSGIARVMEAVHSPPVGTEAHSVAERLAAGLASPAAHGRPAYLRGAPDSAVTDIAVAAAATVAAEGRALLVDLARIAHGVDARQVLDAAATEARLRGAGLVVGPLENLPPDTADRARLLHDLPTPVVLTGDSTWDPRWSDALPLLFDAPTPGQRERGAWWQHVLTGLPGTRPEAADALSVYKLSPHRMRSTVSAAVTQAAAEHRPVTAEHLLRSARLHNAADLERVARRVEPSADWSDLVLPDQPTEQLRELADRHRHRGTVLTDWRLRPHHGQGRGVAALFTGESGTGKTLAAEVLAAAAGVDLYVVNLATVVDKYIGETEKNLERVFTAAADVQGMLFFDEADALFGKRSKVTDAHDRFANIETAYLLQRLESFDGLAVLATNLSGNVDQAFLRRLDTIIHFPNPGAAERTRLWDLCLGPAVPRAAGLDLAAVAAAFELTGGSIRACTITAAYQTARTRRPVGTADLFAAVRGEYRKLGRLIDEDEFAVSPR